MLSGTVLQLLADAEAGARAALALVFLASGFGKMQRPREFREAVDAYGVGPRVLRNVATRLIPFTEAAVGVVWGSGYFRPPQLS